MLRIDFFLIFVLAHLIGDFVLQTDKIALKKSQGVNGVAIHCAIVCAVQVALLSIFGLYGVLAGILCGIAHFLLDNVKNMLNKYFARLQSVYFLIDQAAHIALIWFFTAVFAPLSGMAAIQLLYIKIMIGIIALTYVSTVSAKILLRDIYPSMKKEVFFKKSERIIDIITASLITLVIFFLPVIWRVLLLSAAFYFYQWQQKTRFEYGVKVSFIKYLILLLTGLIFYAAL